MFKDKLKTIPHLPGSYQMYNSDGIIIYVGKAKDLYRRVNSYFNREHTGKTAKMVSEVHDFQYIVASSELEAFVLELNLIKKFDPKYNILLRDDKSYPYIEYVSKPYPLLKVSRYLKIKRRDNLCLFGPYPNAYAARRIVNLINRLYPLKKCENMGKNLCLYYHIDECLGYCQKCVDQEKLKNMKNEILGFLRGNDHIIHNKILEKINIYNEQLNFEASLALKEELNYIDVVLAKQKVELHDFVNRDIINYYEDNGFISMEFFFIRSGKLLGHFADIIEITGDTIEEIETYIAKYYTKHEIPKEILVDENINKDLLSEILNTYFITPIKGQKRKLLDLVKTNATINLKNNLDKLNSSLKRTSGANEELRKLLDLDTLYRIDAFDNSNLFGTFAVSGMVVFKDGKKSKNDYRKYKVSVDKNDDYHTMQEILKRRYFRAIEENSELPDLIIVDGGENQINAAKKVIDDLHLKINICGLKKDNHHNTNVLLNDKLEEIYIDPHSQVFHYITTIQDEVHRFAITYHRTLRDKGTFASAFDNISGVGKKRKQELLNHFGSYKRVSEASLEELLNVLPESLAHRIYDYFHNLDSTNQ